MFQDEETAGNARESTEMESRLFLSQQLVLERSTQRFLFPSIHVHFRPLPFLAARRRPPAACVFRS
jgi:hypothetical protein